MSDQAGTPNEPAADGNPEHGSGPAAGDTAPAAPTVWAPPGGRPPPGYGPPEGETPYHGQTYPYGQPPYGQPPYGQPPYGQPPYGQPPYGQSTQVAYPGEPLIPDHIRFASLGRRLGARLVDALIIGFVLGVVLVVAGMIAAAGGAFDDLAADASSGSSASVQDLATSLTVEVAYFLATYGLSFLYEGTMIAKRGATLGKQAVGIKVVRFADGQVPGWGPAFVRWVVPAAAGLFTCGLGALLVYVSPRFDGTKRNRGWHDLAAQTVVIRT